MENNKLDQGVKDLTPTKSKGVISIDSDETDQEKGWSKVGPRKKRNYKKK